MATKRDEAFEQAYAKIEMPFTIRQVLQPRKIDGPLRFVSTMDPSGEDPIMRMYRDGPPVVTRKRLVWPVK